MKIYSQIQIFFVCSFILVLFSCKNELNSTVDLSGTWQVKLDSTSIGEANKWFAIKFVGTKINLPGTLDDAQLGTKSTLKPAINNDVMSNLNRKHQYIGKAWYQREIEIPEAWNKKRINLNLERIIWESKVYLNGQLIGSKNSLLGNHNYDLTTTITPGKHLLTVVIDNSNKYPFINTKSTKYPNPVNKDLAHAYTNHTQIKWNGILGEIALKVSNKNAPTNLQVYPDVKKNKLKVTFNNTFSPLESFNCIITSTTSDVIFNEKIQYTISKNNTVAIEIDRPKELEFWDEFNPKLYDIEVITNTGKIKTRFGFKEIENNKGVLTLNGKRIFLRGNLECVIFPLTGYPPTKKEEWAKLIKKAKAYGLNHLRFHSWCPPKAAFEAADEAGFYYQVELPHWSLKVGEDKNTTTFLRQEAAKMIKDYGNHPSFILMAMGNELQGDIKLLNTLVAELKAKDNRHLYATTTFSFQKPTGTRPEVEDDFFISQKTDKGWIRGQGIFNAKPPHFNTDYNSNSAHINIPLISHEIGQYSVYPDMSEISKYTGVLEPLNFMAVKEDLENKGLLKLAPDFTYASGKLAALLYKEEIERALKTPSFDGFQLLQLQDFSGQGTALVGLLNAFWESKGIISAEEFRQFNSELVPLIRFEKAVYETGETFKASIEIVNFFKKLDNSKINWAISDEKGNVLKTGDIENIDLTLGNNTNLGFIEYPIETKKAQKLTVVVKLEGTKYKNHWNIWVYPKDTKITPENVIVTSSFEIASAKLKEGKKVLLNPDYQSLKGIKGRFVPVFWSPVHFPNEPATMGLLLNEEHPAFNDFPTSSHTDWQWWDLCINSKSIVTDTLNISPIVRVIDNFVTNKNLASVFEARVGNGKLIFSSIDLTSELNKRPVARQLQYSLLKYMNSDAFNPTKSTTIEDLNKIRIIRK